MTDEVRDDTLTGAQRIRAQLLALRGSEELLVYPAGLGGVAAVFGGGFLLTEHTRAYTTAGVIGEVGFAGALAGQLVVLGLLFAATTLLLHGDRRGGLVAAAGGLAALGFALLPPLVAGDGWLTTLLLVVVVLVIDALLGLAMFGLAFFGGLGHRPAPTAESTETTA